MYMIAARGEAKHHAPRALAWLTVFALGIMSNGTSCAQTATTIKTDASWGRTPATLAPVAAAVSVRGTSGLVYNVPGNLYAITQAQGKVAGANLFHSFTTFNVGSGDGAVFTTTSPLNNV